MELKIVDPRELGDAMAAFLIHHMLSEERVKAISSADLNLLWLEWREEKGLPLEDEDWDMGANHYEALVHCLDLYLEGRYVGKLDLVGPASDRLKALLPKAA